MYKTNDLLKYMSDRYQLDQTKVKQAGPVITLSRDYGCPAKPIAKKLAALITRESKSPEKQKKWKWISKEILFEAAKELELDPSNIRYVFDYQKKGMIDDILSAHMNKYYKSDRKIRNTIARVIRSLSIDGNVIIIGRGGVAISKDIPQSLHVHLGAPLEWRSLRVSEKNSMSIEDAREFTIDVDNKRKEFREYFEGKNTDYTRFDITFNCMTLNIDEIAQAIFEMARVRALF